MEKKLRVLMTGPSLKATGGISSVLKSYSRTLADFHFLPTNSRHGSIAGAFVLASTLVLMPFYRLAGYNAVHAHSAMGKSFYRKRIVLDWARFLGFRTIFHCHAGGFRDFVESHNKADIKAFLHKCDSVVVLGEVWEKYFTEDLGCPDVHILHNMVVPPERPVEPHIPVPGRFNMLFIGKICADKGIYDLLKALEDNRDRFGGRVHLKLAGPGETAELESYIREHNLSDMAQYVGTLYGADKDRELRAADALILPSHFEGLPVVLLEAGTYALPSIATTVGSIPELIADGVNGTLVPPRDTAAMGAAIERYLDAPSLVESQGCEAARRAKAYYPDAIAADLNAIYASIPSQKPRNRNNN